MMNENCPSCKQPYPFHWVGCPNTPPVAENIRVMSETPLTDKFYFPYGTDNSAMYVPHIISTVDFARTLERECAALTARLEEAEKEAGRYRWLRSKAKRSTTGKKHEGDIAVYQFEDSTVGNVLSLDALDAAIDAALASKPDTGKAG